MALRFQPVDSDESSEEESDEERRNVVDRRQWFDDSSEEEDETRVVRSQKDKKWEILTTHCAKIKNKLKIQDYVSAYSEFDELNKQLVKADNVIQVEGLPVFYIRTLVRLEDAVAALSKENQKKLSTNNAKSYSKLRINLKKHNKAYEEQIAKFRNNPVESEESSDSEEVVQKKEENKPQVAKKSSKRKERKDESDEEDEEDQEDDDEEDDDDDEEWGEGSESDEESDEVGDRSLDPHNRRAFWTLKEGTKNDDADDKEEADEIKGKKDEADGKKKEKKKLERKLKKETKELKEKVREELFTTDVISAKFQEIVEQRSKRASETEVQIYELINLLGHCKDVELSLKILNLLVLFEVENSKDTVTVVMSRTLWLNMYSHIEQITSLYSPSLPLPAEIDETRKAIISSLGMRVERLSNELVKAFKALDAKSVDYALRLVDNIALSRLIYKVTRFYENIKDQKNLAKLALLSIYQIHYIHDDLLREIREKSKDLSEDAFYAIQDSEKALNSWAEIIYAEGEGKEKVLAALLVTYHHALHGRYEKAKNLFLKANTASQSSDLSLQVFTNRAIIQIGLSAFYNGNIFGAFRSLNEIVSSHRLKELLAQAISANKDKSTSQEREERKRAIPYHMHINTEVVETVYFICAMLIDIPKMAISPQDPDKFTLSKYFKKLMDFHERQASSGLTEGFREYIIAAAQKLRRGYWKEAYEVLSKLDAWKHIPQADRVKDLLLENLKESSMVIYVLTYGEYYENFSKKVLSEKFEITVDKVVKTINPMVVKGEINAQWDGEHLVLQGGNTYRVEFLAEKIKEMVSSCMEANEKLSDCANYLSATGESTRISMGARKKKPLRKLS